MESLRYHRYFLYHYIYCLKPNSMTRPIEGFSKLAKNDKIDWITANYTENPETAKQVLKRYWNPDPNVQRLHDEFIENTLTNYYLPFGIAPNFLIDGNLYAIPMTIEESSVVAAASKAAKFWLERGGFRTRVLGTEKIGQVHFIYHGSPNTLKAFFKAIEPKLLSDTAAITKNMEKRGGGITGIELRDKTAALENYYQLYCTFETVDAMGANFINSCLEQLATSLEREARNFADFDAEKKKGKQGPIEVVMAILSNYVPNCLVRAEVECPVEGLEVDTEFSRGAFAEQMVRAIDIAKAEPYRAVTHNKGVMNGIDAVVLATGNDFRAVEAGIHAYATKDGNYTSLTHAEIKDGHFRFWIEVPLALGTVGGLTSLHPLVNLALDILGNPTAEQLMRIVAVAGLAQNFAALQSLVTTGIQEGHMKMHLLNILNQLGATEAEKKTLIEYFKKNTVTHRAVEEAFGKLRDGLTRL
ncbi:MAG TPA: hydroxymethylglutaryl-CoA reductase, degradative [Pricia sp.]|nr:hydroxymethylglutaryl-CoA reductase, degradative [Pricia sp.]